MSRLETERLILRRMTRDDAPFVLELLNDPGWLRYIGDRGVRTLDDARAYIEKGPVAMVARHGFGLDVVERREGGVPLGICGLIRRETLPDVDLGFAFLPAHRGRGYAVEAARAVLRHGRETLGLQRIVAIATPDNYDSIRLLEKLGLRYERRVTLAGDDEVLSLYAIGAPATGTSDAG